LANYSIAAAAINRMVGAAAAAGCRCGDDGFEIGGSRGDQTPQMIDACRARLACVKFLPAWHAMEVLVRLA
jgi:hypothetical protein